MYVEARKWLVDWLRRQPIGPAGEGSLGMSLLDRYPTGVLHPVDLPVSGIDPTSANGEDSEPALQVWRMLHKVSAHTHVHCAKYGVFWPKQGVAQIHCQ